MGRSSLLLPGWGRGFESLRPLQICLVHTTSPLIWASQAASLHRAGEQAGSSRGTSNTARAPQPARVRRTRAASFGRRCLCENWVLRRLSRPRRVHGPRAERPSRTSPKIARPPVLRLRAFLETSHADGWPKRRCNLIHLEPSRPLIGAGYPPAAWLEGGRDAGRAPGCVPTAPAA